MKEFDLGPHPATRQDFWARVSALKTERRWITDGMEAWGRERYLVVMRSEGGAYQDHRKERRLWVHAGIEGSLIHKVFWTYDRAEADAFFDLLCLTQPCTV